MGLKGKKVKKKEERKGLPLANVDRVLQNEEYDYLGVNSTLRVSK